MKYLRWVVPTAAVVGLLTAAFSFGDSVLTFLAVGSDDQSAAQVPQPAAEAEVKVSGTQHVVTHQSSTEDMLTGSDDVIISTSMVSLPAGTASRQLDIDNGERPSHLCSPYPLRVHNATDQYVTIKVGVPETDNVWTVGLGPGERYQVDLKGPEWYFVSDIEERWYEIYPVDNCQTGDVWSAYKPPVDMGAM